MTVHTLPPMPEIGHTEAYYARLAKMAEEQGWIHAKEAAKVGQYVTLALDPHLEWDAKRRYFRHALRRHCIPPAVAHDLVTGFYDRLAILVRENAGKEALRIASKQDDVYADRLRHGESREAILADARKFFSDLMGDEDRCPSYLAAEDWDQLKLIRNQWV